MDNANKEVCPFHEAEVGRSKGLKEIKLSDFIESELATESYLPVFPKLKLDKDKKTASLELKIYRKEGDAFRLGVEGHHYMKFADVDFSEYCRDISAREMELLEFIFTIDPGQLSKAFMNLQFVREQLSFQDMIKVSGVGFPSPGLLSSAFIDSVTFHYLGRNKGDSDLKDLLDYFVKHSVDIEFSKLTGFYDGMRRRIVREVMNVMNESDLATQKFENESEDAMKERLQKSALERIQIMNAQSNKTGINLKKYFEDQLEIEVNQAINFILDKIPREMRFLAILGLSTSDDVNDEGVYQTSIDVSVNRKTSTALELGPGKCPYFQRALVPGIEFLRMVVPELGLKEM